MRCDYFPNNIRQALLKQVTIQRLKDYLINRGWIEEPFGRDTVLKFVYPCCNEYFDTLIPAIPELVDYDRVVEVAIWGITVVEERSFDEVLSDILPCAQVELVEIRALIDECERLIGKHRDDFALSLSLNSLKAREQNIVEEISNNPELSQLPRPGRPRL